MELWDKIADGGDVDTLALVPLVHPGGEFVPLLLDQDALLDLHLKQGEVFCKGDQNEPGKTRVLV
jgi:hypothetical protein